MGESFTVVDIETTGDLPWKNGLVALGIGTKVWKPGMGRRMASQLMSNPKSLVVAHSNYDLRWLVLAGIPMAEGMQYHDTKVMAFMLDQSQELALTSIAQRYLGIPPMSKPIKQVAGRIMYDCSKGMGLCPDMGIIPIEDVPWEEMEAYNFQDLEITAQVYVHLRGLMQQSGQWDLFLEEEAPLSRLLIEMEASGMPLDEEGTSELLEHTSMRRDAMGEDLVRRTGCSAFNLKSGDQVASYLYDELPTFKVQIEVPELKSLKPSVKKGVCNLCGSAVLEGEHLRSDLEPCLGRANMRNEAILGMIPVGVKVERIGNKYVYGTQTVPGRGLVPPRIKAKKGKTPSRAPIDADNLALLHGNDPWVEKYLEWKSLNTLCTNYLEKWVEVMHDGRLHGRFDQARAETGRIASRDPNLQAIPVVDTPVRKLFRAHLMIGDYSGLDARVAAHFSEDPLMMEIFRNNLDLYGTLASNAWGGPASKANENRGLMKILILSAQYGAQAGSIGDKIRISGLGDEFAKKAPKLLKDMEDTLPRMFEWREEVLRGAKALGYITTISGRRRYLPDLYSDEWWKKTRAERQCVASMVQGSSADIVRIGMITARAKVPPEAAKMVLQVHDEILWEIGPEWTDDTFDLLVDICENAHGYDLNVPMKFEASIGDSWDDKDAQGARAYRVLSNRGA